MWHLQTVVLVFPICLGCAIGAVQTKEPLTNEDSSHALLKDTSENRLYFQGPDYTVNLIPLAILIKIIFVIGYVIKYLLDESSEEIGTYGSTGTGYGASQESVGYNAPSAYEPPAPSYDTHSPSNSYVSPASSYHAPTPTYSAQSSGGTYSRPHRSRVDGVKSVMSSALEKLAELGVSGVVKLSTMLTGEDENGEKEQIKFHDTYGNDITEQVIVLDGQRQGKVEEGPFSNILNRGFESVRRSYLVPESQPQDGLRRRKKNPRPNNEERLSNAPYEFYKSSSASADAQPTPLMKMLPSQSLTPQKQTDPYDKDYYDTEGTDDDYNTLDFTFNPGPPYNPSLHGFQEFGARTKEDSTDLEVEVRPVDFSSFKPNPVEVTRRPSTIQKILLDQNKDKLPFPTAQSVQDALWQGSGAESKISPLYGSKLHNAK